MARKPRDAAWLPVPVDADDAYALKALQDGVASEFQQRRALNWFISKAAMTYDLSFRSDADGGDRETAFAEGRRFVGLQAVKLLNMPAGVLANLRKDNDG